MSEPKELPSKEEVKASGTADWVSEAIQQQTERYRDVAAALGDERDAHSRQKDRLKDALVLPPEPEDAAPPPPDIFAAEREAAERQRQGMASLLGDFQQTHEEQRARLDIFGGGDKKGKRK